ncbi:MAG: hypothetical protein KQI35_10480 [Bacteroidetes bacterium]|nr:hypothetical protein [Bacteroidota bacterium]
MKSKIIPLFVFILFVLVSCEKVKEELGNAASFDAAVDLPEQTIIIDSTAFKSGTAINEVIPIHIFEVTIDMASIYEAKNITSAAIEDAGFEKISLNIIDPEEMTFDFIKSMYMAVSPEIDFANEKVVGSTGEIPEGSTNVTFAIESIDISGLVSEKHFYVGLFGDKKGPIPVSTLTMLLDSKIKFTVNPL